MLEPLERFFRRVGCLILLDRAADPTANGHVQRNGIHIKVFSGGAVRNLSDVGAAPSHTHASHTGIGTGDHHAQLHATAHQPAGADAMAVDAAATTGSLRTLGAGATQAATGNHTHAGGGADISVRALRTAVLSTVHNTDTAVPLNDADSFDTDTMHDPATNNTRITFNTAGKYLMIARPSWGGSSAGSRSVWFRLNGVTNIGILITYPVNALSFGQMHSAFNVFAAADYIELLVNQDSGGALDLNSATIEVAKVLG